MSAVADIISRIPVLQELEPKQAEQAAGLFSYRRFEAGEVIHKEGERRDMLVLIQSGSVEILQIRKGKPSVPLITYGPGDALGEGVLLGESTYFTTAVAKTNVESLAADGNKFCEMLNADIDLKTRIYGRVINSLLMRMTRVAARDTPETLELLSGDTRTEKDLIGEKQVPSDAYFGIQTARALENFQITGVPVSLYPDFIAAFGMVKIAAAKANCDCGVISKGVCDGIVAASHEIIQGKLLEQFSVDVIQGGAGTSTNMNVNEVIANRALEIMGHERGDYQYCMPNDHCNASQSTNDSYPTALKLTMLTSNRRLVSELRELVDAFREKAAEFDQILKMGRTHLQDAVPMSLGQEFEAFALTIEGEIEGLETGAQMLLPINMGGTAVGTGLNAPKGYSDKVVQYLREETGFPFTLAPNLVEATSDTQGFVNYSSHLKSLSIKLIKVCNDLRLMVSGPRAGLAEIRLPEKQPGSSIMPGKVNPVIPEVVNQVCFKIIGNDLTVSMAAQAAQLQLNVMEPVIAASILESVRMMMNGSATLRANCISGIKANDQLCSDYITRSIGVVTALVPVIGYKPSTALAAEALKTGKGVVELVREKGLLTEEQIREVLEPERMAWPLGRD